MVVSLQIDDKAASHLDDLPPLQNLLSLMNHKKKRVVRVCGHVYRQVEKVVLFIEFLHFLIHTCGYRITKIHRVIAFTQKNYFKKFIKRGVKLRAASQSTSENASVKLTCNVLFVRAVLYILFCL